MGELDIGLDAATGAVHDEASSGGWWPGAFFGGGGDSGATGDGFEPAGEWGATYILTPIVPSFGGVNSHSSKPDSNAKCLPLAFRATSQRAFSNRRMSV